MSSLSIIHLVCLLNIRVQSETYPLCKCTISTVTGELASLLSRPNDEIGLAPIPPIAESKYEGQMQTSQRQSTLSQS